MANQEQQTDIYELDEKLRELKEDEAKLDETIRQVEEHLLVKGGSPRENPRFLRIKSFWLRVFYGCIYVALIIAATLYSDTTLALLLAIFAGLDAFEFYRMARLRSRTVSFVVGIPSAVLFPLAALLGPDAIYAVILLSLLALLTWFILDTRTRIMDVAYTFFGASYTGLMLAALVLIRSAAHSISGGVLFGVYVEAQVLAGIFTAGIFASVWANDSFAYLVGSLFGKHKMVPKISPKKTWEGFYAGIVGSLIIWLLMLLIPGTNLTPVIAILSGLLCGAVGVIGDLVESRIKRSSGVKDSGSLIPGHGGMLDRTDSLLLVGITAYFILKLGGVL
ncbi:MAG: phosphatidate cytidylyltransferase [Coriobacteriia bacterium]|nr:phosphatidate cytidylyltransferase [Coriobacteriia bacterium]